MPRSRCVRVCVRVRVCVCVCVFASELVGTNSSVHTSLSMEVVAVAISSFCNISIHLYSALRS